MDAIFIFCKYFGLVIATFSSLVGITSEFKEKGKNGKQKITLSGKIAILLTAVGLVISALSNFLQDKKDEQKATQQIIQTNLKRIDDLEKYQVQINRINEIRFKQDSISRRQDSLAHDAEKIQNQQQIKSNNLLLNQLLVDNYLQTTPEKIDLVVEIPCPIVKISRLLNYSKINIDWSYKTNEFEGETVEFSLSGLIKKRGKNTPPQFYEYRNLNWNENSLIFYVDENDTILLQDKHFIHESVAKPIADSLTDKTNHFNAQLIELKKKDANNSYIILDLTNFNYDNQPWKKIIDFRNQQFYFFLNNKNLYLTTDFTARIKKQHPDAKDINYYLRIDNKSMLKLNFSNETRMKDLSNNWKQFREQILKY